MGSIVPVDEARKDTSNRYKLGLYTGKGLSLPTLAMRDLLGGQILRNLTNAGDSIPNAISRVGWERSRMRDILGREDDAHFIARILHLHLLQHNTMQDATEQ